jgi:polar amino acid transport system permease protein
VNALLAGTTWGDVVGWLPDLWAGFLISLRVTLFSLLFGLPAGLLLCLGLQTSRRAIRWACLAVVEVGRGAPALVLLQFVYFGLPSVRLPITSFASAVLALGWCTGAYTSEIIRAGLDAVPRGQREAASALNLSRIDALRYVLVPQGLVVATPALLGFSILIFQGTTLCFTIALQEIISRAYNIGNTTFLYFPALAVAGLFYAACCIPASLAVSYVEHHAGRRLLRQ